MRCQQQEGLPIVIFPGSQNCKLALEEKGKLICRDRRFIGTDGRHQHPYLLTRLDWVEICQMEIYFLEILLKLMFLYSSIDLIGQSHSLIDRNTGSIIGRRSHDYEIRTIFVFSIYLRLRKNRNNVAFTSQLPSLLSWLFPLSQSVKTALHLLCTTHLSGWVFLQFSSNNLQFYWQSLNTISNSIELQYDLPYDTTLSKPICPTIKLKVIRICVSMI